MNGITRFIKIVHVYRLHINPDKSILGKPPILEVPFFMPVNFLMKRGNKECLQEFLAKATGLCFSIKHIDLEMHPKAI